MSAEQNGQSDDEHADQPESAEPTGHGAGEQQSELPQQVPAPRREQLPRRFIPADLHNLSARRKNSARHELTRRAAKLTNAAEIAQLVRSTAPASTPAAIAPPASSPAQAAIAAPASPFEPTPPPGVLVARGRRTDVAEPASYGGRHESAEPKAPEPRDSEWREIKSGFVEDPLDSVQRAFGLVEEAVADLAATVRRRHESLTDPSGNGDSAPDTEDLRKALLSYREFFDELRRVSDWMRPGTGVPLLHWASAINRQ